MVIQHNLPAINSHRNLGINNKNTAKNLEKLSSGFRINRAGDDAAGLAISEKMRGQISGLGMAIQNSEHGISLIQTAEGGLNETHAILQRMRELAVQASNGTYQEDDRAQITHEIEALKSEIDRIASATHYNGIQLLNGNLSDGGYNVITDVNKIMNSFALSNALVAGDSVTLDTLSYTAAHSLNDGVTATIHTDLDAANAVGTALDAIDAAAFEDSGGNDLGGAITFEIKFGNDLTLNVHVNHANLTAAGAGATALDIVNAQIQAYMAGQGYTYDAASDTITKSAGNGVDTVSDTWVTQGITIQDVNNTAVAGITTGLTTATSILNSTTAYTAGVDDTMIDAFVTGTITDSQGNIHTVDSTYNQADGTYTLSVAATGASFTLNEAAVMALHRGGNLADAELVIELNEGAQLIFQIGANGTADQRVGLSVDDMSTQSIGFTDDNGQTTFINAISLMTRDSANAAIDVIDGATNMVSAQRAKLGALQNRLEHTINNLGVTKENLTAAESTIRDVDMAAEMMDFTKNNILVQAAQAMLAQANALPQGILSLLR